MTIKRGLCGLVLALSASCSPICAESMLSYVPRMDARVLRQTYSPAYYLLDPNGILVSVLENVVETGRYTCVSYSVKCTLDKSDKVIAEADRVLKESRESTRKTQKVLKEAEETLRRYESIERAGSSQEDQ